MALSIAWQFTVGATDLTDRLAGFSINQQLTLNKMASFTYQVTLRNQDGALTPNGGGTYSDWDWFAFLGLRLKAAVSDGTTTTTVVVADGTATAFDLTDNGVESTVTISFVDQWAVGARMRRASIGTFAQQDAEDVLNTATYWSVLDGTWPGGTTPVMTDASASHTRQVKSDTTLTNVTYADLASNVILPALNAWGWPAKLDDALSVNLYGYLVTGNRAFTAGEDFTFTEADAMTSTSLPFSALKQAYNTPELINQATFKGLITGATDQTATASNVSTYGSRAVQYTRAATTSNTVSLSRATELVRRYSESQFLPSTVTLSASQIGRLCTNSARTVVARLLNLESNIGAGGVGDPWLRRVTITWTGTGSASQTRRCIVLGRKIAGTATGDVTITLTLGSWADNHNAFILGYDTLGEDRVG